MREARRAGSHQSQCSHWRSGRPARAATGRGYPSTAQPSAGGERAVSGPPGGIHRYAVLPSPPPEGTGPRRTEGRAPPGGPSGASIARTGERRGPAPDRRRYPRPRRAKPPESRGGRRGGRGRDSRAPAGRRGEAPRPARTAGRRGPPGPGAGAPGGNTAPKGRAPQLLEGHRQRTGRRWRCR